MTEKKELNEQELDGVSVGVNVMDKCKDYKPRGVNLPTKMQHCSNCIHYKARSDSFSDGDCDLGH